MGELLAKKIIGFWFRKTFEIGRIYRNEGSDANHLQEFTNMEFYWAYADYTDAMKLTEELYKKIAIEVFGKTDFETRGHKFDIGGADDKWSQIDYVETVKKKQV